MRRSQLVTFSQQRVGEIIKPVLHPFTDNPLSNVFSNSLLSLAHAKSNKARTVHMESIRIHAGDYSCHAHATLWVNGCVMDAHVFP